MPADDRSEPSSSPAARPASAPPSPPPSRRTGGTPIVLDRVAAAERLRVRAGRPGRRARGRGGGASAPPSAPAGSTPSSPRPAPTPAATSSTSTPTTWERVVRSTCSAPPPSCAPRCPHLERSRGRVVTVASTLGLRALPAATAYCASKFGVVGFTRALAIELGDRVGVTMLVPGGMRTHFFDDRPEDVQARGRTSSSTTRATSPHSVVFALPPAAGRRAARAARDARRRAVLAVVLGLPRARPRRLPHRRPRAARAARAFPDHRLVLAAPARAGAARRADRRRRRGRRHRAARPCRRAGADVAVNLHGRGPQSTRAAARRAAAPADRVRRGRRRGWRAGRARGRTAGAGCSRSAASPPTPTTSTCPPPVPAPVAPGADRDPPRRRERRAPLAGRALGRRRARRARAGRRWSSPASAARTRARRRGRRRPAPRRPSSRAGPTCSGSPRVVAPPDASCAATPASRTSRPRSARRRSCSSAPTPPREWGPPPDRPRHVVLWAGRRGDPHARRRTPGCSRSPSTRSWTRSPE